MAVTDLDIHCAAYRWIQRHGENATAMARAMGEAMRAKGDNKGADMWLRIIVAIAELGAPPTEARH
jgi:hypothetical protein